MARGKTEIRRIENASSRQVTFAKRRNGLLKKASELSVMCDAEVGLVIFSDRDKLCEFASSSMLETIDHYQKYGKMIESNEAHQEDNQQVLKAEIAKMKRKIQQLEGLQSKLLGKGLETCNIDELQHIERNLDRGLLRIRKKKVQLYKQQSEQLEEHVKAVATENAMYKKFETEEDVEASPISDAAMNLFMGRGSRSLARALAENNSMFL